MLESMGAKLMDRESHYFIVHCTLHRTYANQLSSTLTSEKPLYIVYDNCAMGCYNGKLLVSSGYIDSEVGQLKMEGKDNSNYNTREGFKRRVFPLLYVTFKFSSSEGHQSRAFFH